MKSNSSRNWIDDTVDPEEVAHYTYGVKQTVVHVGTGERLLILRRLLCDRPEDAGMKEKYLVRRQNYAKTTVYDCEITEDKSI